MSRELRNAILAHVRPGDAVLDVGAGMAAYHGELLRRIGGAGRLVLLDAHQPYLDRSPVAGAKNVARMQGTAQELLPRLQERYDAVLAIDFIEHLTRPDALAVIAQLRRLGKIVVLFVPEGNHPQDKDYFNLGADHWQTHRSTWQAEDLVKLGFSVDRWPEFHAGAAGKDPGALWAVWDAETDWTRR